MVDFFRYNNTNEPIVVSLVDYPDVDTYSDVDGIYYEGNIDNLRKPWLQEPHFIPTVVVYSLSFLIGFIGNGMVVFAMLGDRKTRNVTTSFLVSLALADLLFLLVCVPYEVCKSSIGHWSIGTFLCKFAGFVEMLTAVASIFNLTAVSVERYIVIVHPMQSRSLCTVGTTKKILTILWILSLLMSCPTFYIMNTESHVFYNNETEVVVTFCADSAVSSSERLVYCIYQFLIMFALPTTVMCFCYSKVIYVLWISTKQLAQMTFTERRPSEFEDESKQRQAFASGNCGSNYRTLGADGRGSGKNAPANSENHSEVGAACGGGSGAVGGGGGGGGGGGRSKSREHKKERRNILKRLPKEQSSEVLHARRQVIKMLIAIILTFLICWGPKLIFRILRRVDPSAHGTNHSYLIKAVFDIFPYIQSCLNPIIYCFMSRNFRKSMRYVCNTHCKCCHYSSGSNETYELETKSLNGTSLTTRATKYGQSVMSNDESTTREH